MDLSAFVRMPYFRLPRGVSPSHADNVVTYMARSGDERTIKSTGWLVNVTRLSTQEASREELPSQLRSLLRVVGRDADVAW